MIATPEDLPVSLTCAIIEGRLIADPTLQEETLADATVSAVVDGQGNIVGSAAPLPRTQVSACKCRVMAVLTVWAARACMLLVSNCAGSFSSITTAARDLMVILLSSISCQAGLRWTTAGIFSASLRLSLCLAITVSSG